MTQNHFQIYLNEPGVEYWYQALLAPSKIVQIDLDTNQVDTGVGYVRAQMSLTVEKKVSRKIYQCDDSTSMQKYTKCLLDDIGNEHPCSAFMEKYGEKWNASKICDNSANFNESQGFMKSQMKEALVNDTFSKCVKPCKTLTYGAELISMHKNSKLVSRFQIEQPGAFFFGMYFEQFKINYKEEYVLMTWTNFFSTIGGFLGLFMGYSILTLGEWISVFAKK